MNNYSLSKAFKEILASVKVYLSKDENGEYLMKEENRLPIFLQGAPGVGKTAICSTVAEELGIGFASLSITHHTRNTVLGLPVIEELKGEEGKYTSYTMSEIIAIVKKKVEEGYKEGILLLDEILSCSESLLAPLLAFLQTKNIGNHYLPEGWVLIVCGNPSEYNHSSRRFDMAIMDRLRVIDICYDPEDFLAYGKEKGLHSAILDYLTAYPEDNQVYSTDNSGEQIIVTPRGWENLSHSITGYERMGAEVSQKLVRQFIKSTEISERFFMFYQSAQNGLNATGLDAMLRGENIEAYISQVRGQSFDKRFAITELVAERIVQDASVFDQDTPGQKKMKKARLISDEITNACVFIEGISMEDNLMGVFINTINRSHGVLHLLTEIKNPMYLKYNKVVTGLDDVDLTDVLL